MINLQTIVEPPEEPVTLQEMYDLLRLDPLGSPPTHPHDAMLTNMIKASRQWVENYTKRSLVYQTVRLVINQFPRYRILVSDRNWEDDAYESRSSSIELPRPPFIQILDVTYFDTNNQLQTMDPTTYFVSDLAMVPALRVNDYLEWPETYRREDAVRITYITGYAPVGSPPSDYISNIPEPIKQAIRFGVQLQYDDLTEETRTAMEAQRVQLLGSYRVYSF